MMQLHVNHATSDYCLRLAGRGRVLKGVAGKPFILHFLRAALPSLINCKEGPEA